MYVISGMWGQYRTVYVCKIDACVLCCFWCEYVVLVCGILVGCVIHVQCVSLVHVGSIWNMYM